VQPENPGVDVNMRDPEEPSKLPEDVQHPEPRRLLRCKKISVGDNQLFVLENNKICILNETLKHI